MEKSLRRRGLRSMPLKKRYNTLMDAIVVRKLVPTDIPWLVRPIAEAFAPQPVTTWVSGCGEAGVRRGEVWIRVEFESALPHNLIYTTAARQGAAMWYPPGANVHYSLRALLRLAGTLKLDLTQMPAQLRLLRWIERSHPKFPHYYLRILAVDRRWHGQGMGTALMKPIIERCDAEGLPAYLETSTPGNVRFYQGRGFKVQSELALPAAGAAMVTMLRPPGGH